MSSPARKRRVGDPMTPRQLALFVAQSGYTREVRACAAFCLAEKYPLDASAFLHRFTQEFSCTRTRTFVGSGSGAARHYVVHGQRPRNLPKPTRPVSSERIARANRRRRLLTFQEETELGAYVPLLEMAFKRTEFSVVGRQWRSWMAVYQEPEKAHCYYVAVLNLLLHIPGVRNHVLSRFGISRGTTDEQLFLDSFMDSSVGQRIWRDYAWTTLNKTHRRASLISDERLHEYMRVFVRASTSGLEDASFSKVASSILPNLGKGGWVDLLMQSFLTVLELEEDVVFLGVRSAPSFGSGELTKSMQFMRAMHDIHRVGIACLVSGYRDRADGGAGHAIALFWDTDGLVVHNHGQSSSSTTLLRKFFTRYPNDVQLRMFSYELPRRRLGQSFDQVASPKTTKMKRCRRGFRRDKKSGHCLPKDRLHSQQ